MKKRTTTEPKAASRQSNVQRASVKRAQQAGKQQAAASARRVAPPVRPVRRAREEDAEVSVPTPDVLRRAFVWLVSALALGMIAFVVVRNVPGWGQFLPTLAQTPPAPAAAVSAAADISKRIGLVSGHRGNDSGSVCQDGLTEAQVNFDTAVRVASLLRAQGYTVDVLDEFDARLKGYQARALVSIHADSCTFINNLATGYKVARVLDSKMPEEEDRLVSCIKTRYAQATGLRFHANTVTYDMTKYHAFYEIDERTPAAIIETGFLYMDRQLLTRRPEAVAQGIVDGILCFVEGQDQRQPGQGE
jgi:N-acetylmuramoyl-L-alanine amidase